MSPAPYYQDDAVTLYHGDCLDVLPLLSGVDLVFTSPPYNLGTNPGGVFGHWTDGGKRGGMGAWAKPDTAKVIDYGQHNDSMPYEAYRDWQREVIAACWRALSSTGAIFYNHKPRVQRDGLLLPTDLLPSFVTLRQIVIWDRMGGFNFTQVAYTPSHEWLMVLAPEGFRLRSPGCSRDVWEVRPDVGAEHPAPFPLGLPSRAIQTTAAALVCDPFAGSGTTLRAAKDVGVKAIGIEINERFCEIAANRMAQSVFDLGGAA